MWFSSNNPGEFWWSGIPAHILWALDYDLAKLTIALLWRTGEITTYTYILSRVNEDSFLYITPGRTVGALVRDARLQEILDMLRLPESHNLYCVTAHNSSYGCVT